MTLSIINDTHIGVVRSGGTTPASAYKLRQYVLESYEQLLARCHGTDVLVNGDLFDTGNIPFTDLWRCVEITKVFMDANSSHSFYCPGGNHDYHKNQTLMSSFQMFCKMMEAFYPSRFLAIHSPTILAEHNLHVIPHMTNQELFDLELTRVPNVKFLALHANYDNHFAQQSDHSLNLSEEQAKKLNVECVVMGHEHQRKMALMGKVMLPGNQIPTSVADCLGNSKKFMARLTDKLELVEVWEAEGSFQQVDWRTALTDAAPTAQFIRVEGEATSAESAAVVSAIAKLRNTHNAFVITNSVAIEGRKMDGEKITLEQIQGYNITEALMKRLKPEQQVVIKKLMEENNVQGS